MYYTDHQIALQEVPGEISICFSISGCKVACEGCHSPQLWKADNGEHLDFSFFKNSLKKYKNMASCVLFMGGEWHEEELIELLRYAKVQNYKTCLYTGKESVSDALKEELTWLKTGKWKKSLGGLDSPRTNQKFIEVQSNRILNHLFLNNNH